MGNDICSCSACSVGHHTAELLMGVPFIVAVPEFVPNGPGQAHAAQLSPHFGHVIWAPTISVYTPCIFFCQPDLETHNANSFSTFHRTALGPLGVSEILSIRRHGRHGHRQRKHAFHSSLHNICYSGSVLNMGVHN